ncbi:hypothetical protein AWB74_03410 [Caballeronia arvi]|uniref:Uncharacterized protein n=1 Tax=Caballeronia arvi TaxID=1777135 RepID=A0A158J527_9BURK|nr:hypothetical protein AWB74_03410 [Caballeronia arvi]
MKVPVTDRLVPLGLTLFGAALFGLAGYGLLKFFLSLLLLLHGDY